MGKARLRHGRWRRQLGQDCRRGRADLISLTQGIGRATAGDFVMGTGSPGGVRDL
ncbi:hypothetical protein [Ottowia sp.]|uniref:hypothetical protein n=1 Tax=Ottowia sp. TaxID=1898956 RepID=UPI0025D39452|nr:hypothetical protein [Ottowia sp.]MBK6612690.1 hypothetical protein [Ottowia sp.]MBK6748182.1 hypothetical protein [Ottowia sp.]